ncbi:unnamed protein product [Rhizophagus irregularis]|nr:unnamed protein product [Rhizophagus irregularis]
MFKESKEDLRSIQRYSKKCNVHVHARNKVKKILSNFDTYLSTVEVRKFINDLEFHAEMRVNVTSAYTVEVLKDQRQNRKLLVNYEETTLSQNQRRQIMCEKKLRDPQRHRMIIYTNVNVETSSSIQQSDQESDSFLSDAPLNCPATLADEEEKNDRHRDSHNVNEKSRWILNDIDVSEKWHLFKEKSLELANGEGLFVESHTQQILSLSHVLLLKPKQHCPLILFALSSIEKVPRSTLKSPIGEVELYTTYGIFLRWSNKQAEESKARKQAKQPDAIINEIDQLTDSEANCPECKNATHASEYMEELKIFCVPEILKSRVSRNGHFALRLIANMHN